ncbi:AAA family ATPase, partial [Streptomyces mirabilis]|uniref:AAA family ATPase n=1 Tax=Streptomyces mirabilis TaxID=68239 RepID=UPI0033F52059
MAVLVITGTGTEVGKTVTTAAVAATAVAAGRSVAVLKPAQTGVRPDENLKDTSLKGGVYPAGTIAMANTGQKHTG